MRNDLLPFGNLCFIELTEIRVVSVTGTPGVGKSTLCSYLAQKYGYFHIDIGKFVIANRIYEAYDEPRKSYVADMRRLKAATDKAIRASGDQLLLLDGSYAHHLVPQKPWVGIFLMRMNPMLLYRRLVRSHTRAEARENSMAEFLGLIRSELLDRKYVVEVDASNSEIPELGRIVERSIKNKFRSRTRTRDWMVLMKEKELRRFLGIVEE